MVRDGSLEKNGVEEAGSWVGEMVLRSGDRGKGCPDED